MRENFDGSDSGSENVEKQGRPPQQLQDRFRALLLITLAATAIFLSTEFFLETTPPNPRSFSFQQTSVSPGTSLSISGITGQLQVSPWSQSEIVLNGTIAATGSGASPSQVTIQQELFPGTVSFQPVLPSPTTSQGRIYTINLNLYFPSGLNFSTISLATTSGNIAARGVASSTMTVQTDSGSIDLRDTSASTLKLNSVSGAIKAENITSRNFSAQTSTSDVQVILATVLQPGTYFGYSNRGTVNLTVPSGSSFKLIAHSLLGRAGYTSGFTDCQTNYTATTVGGAVFDSTFTANCGNGSASISLQSDTGDAIVTRGS